MNRERRTALGRVEKRALTDAEKAAGYLGAITGVIPYNTDSGPLRDRRLNNGQPFVERIAPKAFERSIAEGGDVVAIAGHTDDPLCAFARQGKNLNLSDDGTALRWDALIPNTTAGRDLMELTDKGVVRGTSFEFDTGAADSWEKRSDGTMVRTVTSGRLAAVNPVVWPAYSDSSLSVEMRGGRARRGICADGQTYDYTLTPDASYALEALCSELDELGEALDYLRALAVPGTKATGALASYAQNEVTECAAAIAMLTDWLAKNGADVNPDLMQRAKAKLTEARSATNSPDYDRERRARILICSR